METGISTKFVSGDLVKAGTILSVHPHALDGNILRIINIDSLDAEHPYRGRLYTKDGATQTVRFSDPSTPTDYDTDNVISYLSVEAKSLREDLVVTVDNLSTLRVKGETSMEIISNMFFDEAEKREWCAEAFKFIEGINRELPLPFNIPLREQEFEIEVTVTGTISVHHMVTVKARSQDEAEDNMRDCPDDYFDPEEVLRDENIRYISIDNIEVEID